MSDLIGRLLAVEGGNEGTHWYRNPDGPEAAARIAELEAEVARLREALEPFAREYRSWDLDVRTSDREIRIWLDGDDYLAEFGFADLRRASALAAPDTGGADGE